MRVGTVRNAGLLALCAAGSADASYHVMQIEQVVGGVGGDVSQQAVQLRMRAAGQNQMQFSRLQVRDATGQNPVLLIEFPSPVTNASLGDRILVGSAAFAASQGVAPDFIMTNVIPVAYLVGGKLTFEDDFSIVYSLCWGNYSGPSTGSTLNDADGQYAPCEPGALPSTSRVALQFTGTASAPGTTNAADYALTPSTAIFTNNAGAAAALIDTTPASRGGDCDDTDSAVFIGQAEVAGNRIDDDCDGLADEDAGGNPSLDMADNDTDGVTLNQGDCNDTRAAARPGLAEIVGDLFDNDCDGQADEDASDNPSLDAVDRDGDGEAMFDHVLVSGFEGSGS